MEWKNRAPRRKTTTGMVVHGGEDKVYGVADWLPFGFWNEVEDESSRLVLMFWTRRRTSARWRLATMLVCGVTLKETQACGYWFSGVWVDQEEAVNTWRGG